MLIADTWVKISPVCRLLFVNLIVYSNQEVLQMCVNMSKLMEFTGSRLDILCAKWHTQLSLENS